MSPENVAKLLPLLGTQLASQRTGWVIAPCPLVWNHGGRDNNPSFAISHSKNKKSIFKCLSCGKGGDLQDLLLDIQIGLRKHPHDAKRFRMDLASAMILSEFEDLDIDPQPIPDYEQPEPKAFHPFPEKWLKTFPLADKFPEAVSYWKSRGLTASDMHTHDVRYDSTRRRIGFPFYDFKGKLAGMQGRTIDKDEALRYYQYRHKVDGSYVSNLHIWLGEHKVNFDEPVVLCEGPFDYAKIHKVYPNVLASFTTGLSKRKINRVATADTIITFYDFGKGGNAARKALRESLTNCAIIDIVPNEQLGDPGAMDASEIAEMLSPHVPT